jgi:hypothetical protein
MDAKSPEGSEADVPLATNEGASRTSAHSSAVKAF